MLLAIDAGNTHIVLGCFEGDSLRFTARLCTDRAKTRDEYALLFRSLFDLSHILRIANQVRCKRMPERMQIILRDLRTLTDFLQCVAQILKHRRMSILRCQD